MAGITLGPNQYNPTRGLVNTNAGQRGALALYGPPPPAPRPPAPPPPQRPPAAPMYMPMQQQAPAQSPSIYMGGNSYSNTYNTMAPPPVQPIDSPSMEGLNALGAGEGLAEGLQREGWSGDPSTELEMPGGRSNPASSRALAQLAARMGRVY